MHQPLLEPFELGSLTLPNRLVMAPLTRCRADNQEQAANDLIREYYVQRASAGLIISEGTYVSRMGAGYVNVPGIYSEAQVDGWRRVTDAVHLAGGRMFAQIWHVGPISHPEILGGDIPLSPSGVNPHGRALTIHGRIDTETPRVMTYDEIKRTVDEFRQGAANAVRAGFDGIEVHGANGYLIHQFLSGSTNFRSDEYGRSIENRARFLIEILESFSGIIDYKRVGVRLNPGLTGSAGIVADEETIPMFEYVVDKLNRFGIAYQHIMEPMNPVEGTAVERIKSVSRHFRPLVKTALITNFAYTRESGNQIVADGLADLVAYGKAFIANPDLVERFRLGAPLNEPDPSTFYGPGAHGYTDYPALAMNIG